MQVANKRVTKFTTKIFNILISFDMRTLKNPKFLSQKLGQWREVMVFCVI